jgi:hypothetical protein
MVIQRIEMVNHPQFEAGDPTLLGWLTVAVYLCAAFLSILCAWRADRIFPGDYILAHRIIWSGLAIGMLFLGINKQLDLQTQFTSLGRQIAFQQGWYEIHHRVQVMFVAGLVCASLLLLGFLAWTIRRSWKHYWILLIGLLFLARFIVVRAASFYNVSLPQLSRFTGGFRINWLLEILGAALVCVSALNTLKPWKKATPQINGIS